MMPSGRWASCISTTCCAPVSRRMGVVQDGGMRSTAMASLPEAPRRETDRRAAGLGVGDGARRRAALRPYRSRLVGIAKRLLPLGALGLLLMVAFYPELNGSGEHGRVSFGGAKVTPEGGQLTEAHYQGVD